MPNPYAAIGYEFEKKTRTALEYLHTTEGVFYVRLPDSKAAGSFLEASPADFLVAFDKEAVLIETKASSIHNSLRDCAGEVLDKGQASYHAWWRKNGFNSWHLFYSERLGLVEAWHVDPIVDYVHRKIKLPEQPYASNIIDQLDELIMEIIG